MTKKYLIALILLLASGLSSGQQTPNTESSDDPEEALSTSQEKDSASQKNQDPTERLMNARELKAARLKEKAAEARSAAKKAITIEAIHRTARANKRRLRKKADFKALEALVRKDKSSSVEELLDNLAREASTELLEDPTLLQDIAQIKADLAEAEREAMAAIDPIISTHAVIRKIASAKNAVASGLSETDIATGSIASGDHLIVTLVCQNEGQVPANNLVITYPIPPSIAYLESSYAQKESMLLYSADGESFFETLEEVEDYVQKRSTQKKPEKVDISHVRWIQQRTLQPEDERTLTFRAIVR